MKNQPLPQRAYSAIMTHFINTGFAPHYSELAQMLNVTIKEAQQAQRVAVKAAPFCWFIPETDYIHAFAPFSNVPTQYKIRVDGKPNGFALCGPAVFGLRWVFPGQEISVESPCLDCGDLIRVRIRDDEILELNSPDLVCHFNIPLMKMISGEESWAFG